MLFKGLLPFFVLGLLALADGALILTGVYDEGDWEMAIGGLLVGAFIIGSTGYILWRVRASLKQKN